MADTPRGIPATVNELIDYLDRLFPEQSAELRWTDREVWFKAGARSVVRHLRAKQQERDENIMEIS